MTSHAEEGGENLRVYLVACGMRNPGPEKGPDLLQVPTLSQRLAHVWSPSPGPFLRHPVPYFKLNQIHPWAKDSQTFCQEWFG